MTPVSDIPDGPAAVSPARHETQWLAQREPPPVSTVPATADLEPLQRELLIEEARALAEALVDPERRARYAELAEAVEAGHAPEHLADAVHDLLELGLETGRFRRRYTAEGEQALLALYRRTPRGAAVQATATAANEALGALRGRQLQNIAFTSKGPGAWALAVATDAGRVSLRIARDGVWVESVEVDS